MHAKFVPPVARHAFLGRLLRWLAFVAAISLIFFTLAGRWDVPELWGLVGILAAFGFVALLIGDPSLARERFRPPDPGADPLALLVIRFAGFTMVVVAILDVGRFGWSGAVAPAVQVLGFAAVVVGMAIVGWAMVVNPFFSTVIRIQEDRGHHVITRGPYQWVRHPGYLGMVIAIPAIPFALGSWWAVAPGLIYAATIMRRVAVEDRYLRQHLFGYAEYAHQVRHRVVRGAW